MNASNPNHPLWPLLRQAIFVVALGMCLYFNYSTFDPIKDPRAMLIMALLGLGIEGGVRLLRGVTKQYEKTCGETK